MQEATDFTLKPAPPPPWPDRQGPPASNTFPGFPVRGLTGPRVRRDACGRFALPGLSPQVSGPCHRRAVFHPHGSTNRREAVRFTSAKCGYPTVVTVGEPSHQERTARAVGWAHPPHPGGSPTADQCEGVDPSGWGLPTQILGWQPPIWVGNPLLSRPSPTATVTQLSRLPGPGGLPALTKRRLGHRRRPAEREQHRSTDVGECRRSAPRDRARP